MGNNPRLDKIKFTLWLTKDEARLLEEVLKSGLWSSAFLIIKEAKERGDFYG
jgi:hypothetical protein